MHRVWKHILIITPLFVFVTLMGFFIFYPVPKPPVGEMRIARVCNIHGLKKERRHIFRNSLLLSAKSSYDSAMIFWKRENENGIYSRNYKRVAEFAALAAEKAFEASI